MFYRYKVTYWDSFESEEKEDSGLTVADTYGAATTNLLNAYGEDYLIDMYLCELVADDNVINDEEIESAIKHI